MPLIDPSICTTQEIYDYCGISAAEAAAAMPSGTLLSAWFAKLQLSSAWTIRTFLGRDYTPTQVNLLRFRGNNSDSTLLLTEPGIAPTIFRAWDDSGTEVTATLALNIADLKVIYTGGYELTWTKGPFLAQYRYEISYPRSAAQDQSVAGWPEPIKQVQKEMCLQIWNEGTNGKGRLGLADVDEYHDNNTEHVLDMNKRWQQVLRPFRRFTA